MSDLIDRQAAIDALKSQLSDWNDDYNIPVRKSIENIERLPPAQPELLTDKEQRIFLAAMEREEEVCKDVDDVWRRDCRELYKDSLVRVCKEIRRKVKGALWT